jgi:diguanylate cyclase
VIRAQDNYTKMRTGKERPCPGRYILRNQTDAACPFGRKIGWTILAGARLEMNSTYNPWLVSLSIGVAILVSFTSLRLASRVAESDHSAGRAWLILGAISMGFGIWSMHFIGMLAFSIPIQLRYDVGVTFGSMGVAILTSGFAIKIASSPKLGLVRHVICSLVMACGIVTMHYMGMSAIRVVPSISYDLVLVVASVGIAITASFTALWLTFNLRGETHPYAWSARLVAAAIMGSAIAGMHYTAMAATQFQLGAYCRGGVALDNRWLGIFVAMGALALLTITLITTVFDAHLKSRARLHTQRLQQINARLSYQSTHDALTDLPNRSLFIDRLEQAIAESTSANMLIAVMLVDLDRFKIVNDSLGHGYGDVVLQEVAMRLRDSIGDEGITARLGGDEFLVLARVAEGKSIVRITNQIVERISRTYMIGAIELHLAASVGITTYPFDNSVPNALISHADEAMHEIKREGGNGYRFFVPGTTVFTMERLQLENELRHAQELGQLELHYQPQVEIASGRIVALEALARWRHPSRGWVPPSEFIPLAESSDLIVGIGRWVLDEACRQTRKWCDQGFIDISIAINLSARQFRQPDLLSMIQQAIASNGLQTHQIVIELTESVVMSDPDRAIHTLVQLHRSGLQIAVDDFGTGYSSMSYLKRLPVSKLKIDRSFINDLGTSAKNDSIVKAVIALAQGLGMIVVAEGVETKAQLSCLRAFGCDQYQGYLSSRPRNSAETTEMLHGRSHPVIESSAGEWLLGSTG